MRLFLDANILFSAAWRDDNPAERLLGLAANGYCALVTSRLAIEEARRNLRAQRATRVANLDALLTAVEVCVDPVPADLERAQLHGLPDKDVPILAAAIVASADALVTGDRRHFGRLYGKRIGGVMVTGLADALVAVAQRKSKKVQGKRLLE